MEGKGERRGGVVDRRSRMGIGEEQRWAWRGVHVFKVILTVSGVGMLIEIRFYFFGNRFLNKFFCHFRQGNYIRITRCQIKT